MTINDLGALGDFFGGIAVIVGLFFVGFQLLASNRESRIALNQLYADSIIEMGELIYETSEMADTYLRGLQGLANLEEVERVRFVGLVGTNILRRWDNLHAHHESGRLEQEVWRSAETMLGAFVNTKGFSDVWEVRKSWYRHSFQIYIENLMEKGSDIDLASAYEEVKIVENDT